MKLSKVSLNSLPDGVYYYCSNCKHWFGEKQPLLYQHCPDCGWLWQNAQGTYIKESRITVVGSPPATTESVADLATQSLLIVLLVLAGSYWGYVAIIQPVFLSAWRQTQTVWSNLIEGVGVGLEFIGSLLLSLVVLAGVTLLLFVIMRYFIYLIILIFATIATVFNREKYQPSPGKRAASILDEHSFLVGTLTNLISGFCALLIASWIFQRPPDYWDFGIQFVIALVIEIVVFSSSE